MASLWPWLAVAGVGALHGLNPATGWMFAAAWGVRSRDRAQALRALLPIAVGHAASCRAGGRGGGARACRWTAQLLQAWRGALLLVARPCRALARARHRAGDRVGAPAGHAGLALWSFLMATAHGAGLMLVPALMPLCAAARQCGARDPALSGRWRWRWPPSASTPPRCWSSPACSPPACAAAFAPIVARSRARSSAGSGP